MRFNLKAKNEISGEISGNKKTKKHFNFSTFIIALTIIFSIAICIGVYIKVDISYVWSNTPQQLRKVENLSNK